MAVDQSKLAGQLANRAENKPATQGTDLKSLMNSPAVKKRFDEVLDKRSPQFMSSILNLVNADNQLKVAEPMSVISSCMIAATLDLPIDKNLGYAWIIAYKNHKTGVTSAQFQMGYKGYIQLALRTARYKFINAIPVYEGELVKWDRLTEELVLNEDKKVSDQVIGYAGFFELINGFRKTVYWPRERIDTHRKRFSKQRPGGTWDTDFDGMALKTVIRNMLSKWGILSIEMQTAYSQEVDTKIENGGEDFEDAIDVDFTIGETDAEHPTETNDQDKIRDILGEPV